MLSGSYPVFIGKDVLRRVLEGIQKLITAIDSDTVIDIDSISETISKLTERLDRLEIQPTESRLDIDIDSATQTRSGVSERLEKVESDLTAIALTIQDLSTRVSSLEGVGDIGYAVTPLSELEALFDSRSDIEMTAESEDIDSDIASIAQPLEPPDISIDSVRDSRANHPPYPPAPQTAFSARFSQTPELPGQSCRETTQAGQRKFRCLEPRTRPGRRGVDLGGHWGTGAPAAVYSPLVS
jgi:hypothetical protein